MELCYIYYGFWEEMKEISVGVCLNEYTWLEIWEKKSGLFKKTKWKKNGLEQKQKKRKKKNEKKRKKRIRSAIWALLCKASGIDVIGKEKLCSTSL